MVDQKVSENCPCIHNLNWTHIRVQKTSWTPFERLMYLLHSVSRRQIFNYDYSSKNLINMLGNTKWKQSSNIWKWIIWFAKKDLTLSVVPASHSSIFAGVVVAAYTSNRLAMCVDNWFRLVEEFFHQPCWSNCSYTR